MPRMEHVVESFPFSLLWTLTAARKITNPTVTLELTFSNKMQYDAAQREVAFMCQTLRMSSAE